MAIRNIGKAPLEFPVMKDSGTDLSWQRWFSHVAERVFHMDKYSLPINPTSVSANSTSEQTFSLGGVASNDFVLITKPSHTSGLAIGNVRVSAINTIAITFINVTGSPIDPPSESYTILVMKV